MKKDSHLRPRQKPARQGKAGWTRNPSRDAVYWMMWDYVGDKKYVVHLAIPSIEISSSAGRAVAAWRLRDARASLRKAIAIG